MAARQGPRVKWNKARPIAPAEKTHVGRAGNREWLISRKPNETFFAHTDWDIPLLMTWKAPPGDKASPIEKVFVSAPSIDGIGPNEASRYFLRRMGLGLKDMPPGPERREYRKMLARLRPPKQPKPEAGKAQGTNARPNWPPPILKRK